MERVTAIALMQIFFGITSMDKVRLGIIGMGNIGTYHADYLLKGAVSRCELTAICSRNTQSPEKYHPRKIFCDAEEMIRSGEINAVIIATPPYQHTPLGITAFGAGVHAMVEKPIAAHKADAQRLNEAHQQYPEVVFGGMFQLRTEPRYLKIRQLITSGELGDIVRVNWINTDWYRTEAYYASGAWRASWRGEGGGVLLNQCLHNLDILQWLCGMPARVRGFCGFGRYHDIETEDNATAYFEWANGATGTFIGSSGEAPGTNRLEIVGTQGRLMLENGRLQFTQLSQDMSEFSHTASQGFGKPEVQVCEIPFENASAPHAAMMQNFVDAILDGERLIVPGEEGIHSVELANAIVFSSLIGETIELPMDAGRWERKLNQLIAESTHEKKVALISSDDFASSFRK
jgi:predicted dehydrogenase